MSIDIRELDASLILRRLSEIEKFAVVRLAELAIEEARKSQAERITKLEEKITKANNALNRKLKSGETVYNLIEAAREALK